jgi:Ca-activated chloride channel family protein
VILATDGDFNVGLSSDEELKSLIEEKRRSGLFLSVLGFGRGGNDSLMETLADNGNCNYASIDSLNEARKVLVKEAGATLVTVAKDVKFQVAFDPAEVTSYRLIGYKNRRLATRDFEDDTKDAGDLGAGHSVTALYEIKRVSDRSEQALLEKTGLKSSDPIAEVRLRYKAPDSDESELMTVASSGKVLPLAKTTRAHQWAAGVAGFGLRLESELSDENMSLDGITALLQPTMSAGADAYQAEFYSLVKKSGPLLGSPHK